MSAFVFWNPALGHLRGAESQTGSGWGLDIFLQKREAAAGGCGPSNNLVWILAFVFSNVGTSMCYLASQQQASQGQSWILS